MPEPQTQATTPPGADAIPQDAAMLAATLLERSMAETQAVTNRLLDSYKERAEVSEARIAAIRAVVGELFEGQWMPTPASVMSALFPTDSFVRSFRPTEDRDG